MSCQARVNASLPQYLNNNRGALTLVILECCRGRIYFWTAFRRWGHSICSSRAYIEDNNYATGKLDDSLKVTVGSVERAVGREHEFMKRFSYFLTRRPVIVVLGY